MMLIMKIDLIFRNDYKINQVYTILIYNNYNILINKINLIQTYVLSQA